MRRGLKRRAQFFKKKSVGHPVRLSVHVSNLNGRFGHKIDLDALFQFA